MAAGASISVQPSGRPQTARSCCSNWLVMQASMVRWPELCGRGASSLIRSLPIARQEELHAENARSHPAFPARRA